MSNEDDYFVEDFVKPKKIRKTINGEYADLLGNFDEAKRKAIYNGTFTDENDELAPSDDVVCDFSDTENIEKILTENGDESENDDDKSIPTADEINKNLTKEQLEQLLRGTSKTNHYVLYVTNLNFDTTKEDLEACFTESAGHVKSVRIPKKRRGGYAFVEMSDINGFHKGFQLHNTELHGRKIKIQLSEAGKKKSVNKKNILKQKNRKLAEMRNEQKAFTKSGKFYDKRLKKEKSKELIARKRWRKKPTVGNLLK